MVPTVTRPNALPAEHDQVNNPVPVQLILELTSTDEHIEGTVRCGDRPATPFSGWSELFAALLTAATRAGQHTPSSHRITQAADRRDRRT